ncbi:MAG: hypothetical protein WCQ95_01465 [Bacteroidota bacterium]
MKIVYKIDAAEYLINLIDILFEKEYFQSIKSSAIYVSKIRKEIDKTIHLRQKYNTPTELKKHGMYYKKITINKGTTWVVYFNFIKDTYYINFISNNHSRDAKFIEGLK